MAKSSDIIKIGFDYKASLAEFKKETNGVFDGISTKADKQKIVIQLDAKNDKVIEKIKELQKLKLDKFTFEFGNSGIKEQLKTFAQLENKINEIINLSRGITNKVIGNGIGNSIIDEKKLDIIVDLFSKMESHLGTIKKVFSDVGDGTEFSPLLSTINKINYSIEKLSNSVKGIGLNMNIDVGSNTEMESKVQSKIANALQTYQRLFEHLKMSSAGGSIINTKFFEFDINQYDTTMGKLQAYRKFIDNMRKEAKERYGKDVLFEDTDKSYWSSASAAMGQVTRAFNEMNASADSNSIENLFGGKTDLTEVVNQLNLIVDKLSEISNIASEFKNTFDNSFNVSGSVEEIDKLTIRVKELEEELSKVKLNPIVSNESNISSEKILPTQELDSAVEKYQEIVSLVKEYYELSQKLQNQTKEFQTRPEDYDKIDGYLLSKSSSKKVGHTDIEKDINKRYHEMSKGINEGSDFAIKAMKSAIQRYWSDVTEMPSDDKLLSSRKAVPYGNKGQKEEYIIPKKYQELEKSVIQETIALNKNNAEYEEERRQIEANNAAIKERMNIIRSMLKSEPKNKDYDGDYRMGLSLKANDGKTDIFNMTQSMSYEDMLQEICNMLGIEIPKASEKAQSALKEVTDAQKAQSSTPIKDVFQADTKLSEMGKVATTSNEAVQAKKDFAEANEDVQSSVDGSKSKLELEAELMESLAKTAREAADAKKEFVEANKLVQDSVDDTGKSEKKDKYKDKAKISEDDYIQHADYFSSIANQKLTDSGNTILGNNVSTELVDGLVKVNAKIKDADGAWKTFSAKIDADGNMFEQRFRAITKNVDKLESELEDFGHEISPALTYQETLDKANEIRRSHNLGDDFQIKVDSNELVTITKKMSDVDSATTSVTQTFKSAKDAIQHFGQSASNSAEKTSVALKGVKQSADTSVGAVKEEGITLKSMQAEIDNLNKKSATFKKKPDDQHSFVSWINQINELDSKIAEYKSRLDDIKAKGGIVDKDDETKINRIKKEIQDLVLTMSKTSAGERGWTDIGATKTAEKLHDLLVQNSNISEKAKDQIRAYYNELTKGNPSKPLNEIYNECVGIVQKEREAGREGKRFLDVIKDKAWYGWAAQLASMFSFYDIINIGKQGFEVIKDLDTALTEMRKVSDESISSLERFQGVSFDLADGVGTTAKQIQNSTADYMRLGETLDEATESARVANILLNVSEFDNIDDATSSLVSMGQAYKDLDKIEIIDKLNEVGNNYSISTDELAVAMQKSAATLSLMGNSIDETASMITTANSVLQDADTVSAGLRTISLRIVGTEEAEEQLQVMNEEIDAFVTQTNSKKQQIIKDYTAVASNNYNGFDILNENGNYKSTYDILLGISKIYKEIQEEDKKLGTNRAVALVEELAGKNRSNVASAILSDPTQLEAVKKSSEGALGSAQEELDKYLESIDGRMQKLSNQVQESWYKLIDSDSIKNGITLLTELLGLVTDFGIEIDTIDTKLGGINSIIGTVAGTIAQLKSKSGGLIRLIHLINNSPFLATVEFNSDVYDSYVCA